METMLQIKVLKESIHRNDIAIKNLLKVSFFVLIVHSGVLISSHLHRTFGSARAHCRT